MDFRLDKLLQKDTQFRPAKDLKRMPMTRMLALHQRSMAYNANFKPISLALPNLTCTLYFFPGVFCPIELKPPEQPSTFNFSTVA